MNVIKNDNCIFFDVDGTLVMWRPTPEYTQAVYVKCPYTNKKEMLYLNQDHVKLLEKAKGRGKHVIVWSHAGWQWAEAVVTALNLEHLVDDVMSKPIEYVDDVSIQDWDSLNLYIKNYFGG